MSGNMLPLQTSNYEDVDELESFMKEEFRSLHDNDGKRFTYLMKQLKHKGVYAVEDLANIDDDILDSLDLLPAQKNKMRSLIKQKKGDDKSVLNGAKNMVSLILNPNSNGSPTSKPKVNVKDNAVVKMSAADSSSLETKGKNVASVGIGDVDVVLQDNARFEGAAGGEDMSAKSDRR